MGKRSALMYRSYKQSWLARKIVARQPLLVHVANHQRLLQALDLTGRTAGALQRTAVQSNPRTDNPWQVSLPVTSSVFLPPSIERVKSERKIAPLQDEAEGILSQQVASVKSESQLVDVLNQEESVSAGPSLDPRVMEVLEVQVRDYQPEQQITAKTESSASELDIPLIQQEDVHQRPELNEPVEAKFQQEQEGTAVHGLPKESAKEKRPRGRIEEHSSEIGRVVPSPPSSSAKSAQRDDHATKALERSVGNASVMSREETAADDLFAPRDTDRSPQAWLVRLMGMSSPKHDDEVAPSVTAEMRQGDKQPSSGGNKQAVPSKTREDLAEISPITASQDGRNVVVPLANARSRPPQLLVERKQAESGQQVAGRNQLAPGVMRDVSLTQHTSTPLSQRTKRFLQPLVGIDLTRVRLHRDAIAERLTDTYQADAILVGDDVELAVGHPDDTPKTLGLLAHEFTHVARQREPRFIPPIARSMSPAPSGSSQSSLADEETLALQVESRVKQVAQKQVDQLAVVPAEPAGDPTRTTHSVPVSQPAHDIWGGLPAPWEPLPDWLITLSATAESRKQAPVVTSQPSPITHGIDRMVSGTNEAHSSANRGTDVSPVDTGLQRAGRERRLDVEEEQKTTSRQEFAKTPEPNLDQLARQVYSILKRRLDVEYRRES